MRIDIWRNFVKCINRDWMVTGVDIGLYEVLSKSFVYLGQTNKQQKKTVPLRIRLISLSKPLWSLLPFLITCSVRSVIFLFTLNVRRPGFRVEKQSSWWELDVVQSFQDSRLCIVWGANWWPGGVNALTGVRLVDTASYLITICYRVCWKHCNFFWSHQYKLCSPPPAFSEWKHRWGITVLSHQRRSGSTAEAKVSMVKHNFRALISKQLSWWK